MPGCVMGYLFSYAQVEAAPHLSTCDTISCLTASSSSLLRGLQSSVFRGGLFAHKWILMPLGSLEMRVRTSRHLCLPLGQKIRIGKLLSEVDYSLELMKSVSKGRKEEDLKGGREVMDCGG